MAEEQEKPKVPTWGYHATEPARVFNLEAGEKLPKGYQDSPAKLPASKAE